MSARCQQYACTSDAAFRFTWPGQDESFICAEHAPKLRAVAKAIGLHLQLHDIAEPHTPPEER